MHSEPGCTTRRRALHGDLGYAEGQGVRRAGPVGQVSPIPDPIRFSPREPYNPPWSSLARDAKTPRNLAPRADEGPEKSPILDRGTLLSLACVSNINP
jgi:hypothetical protein